MQLFPPPSETLAGIAAAIRDREITCVAVLERCLRQIDALEPQIRAWVSIDRTGALADAAELDALLAGGTYLGPLHGIPLGIKDIVDIAGLPTAAGFPPFETNVALETAPVVSRLIEAGAVILGKTVTTQFAGFDPPVTRNPWNLEHTPGGSSSGSAAAVAAGMCLGAIGSQTGGSITRPASYCGVAGCKPTWGRVSTRGIVPISFHLDHPGPIARTVRDTAIMLDAILDSAPSSESLLEQIERQGDNTLRVGRLRGLFDERADASVRGAMDNACQRLAEAGVTVVEVPLPREFDGLAQSHRTLMAAEAAEVHERWFAELAAHYSPNIRQLVTDGQSTSAIAYIRARRQQLQLREAMTACFADCDVLLTPATTTPAPDCSTTGNLAFNAPWSFTGLPTVSFPCELSKSGLPLAVQLVGTWNGEAALFRAALACETALTVGTDF